MTDPDLSEAARKLAGQSNFLRGLKSASGPGSLRETDRFKGRDYGQPNPREGATSSEVKAGIIEDEGQQERQRTPADSNIGNVPTPPLPARSESPPTREVASQPASEPEPVTTATTVRLKLNGNEVDMPVSQVAELVGKAAKAEQAMAEARTIEQRGLAGAGFVNWYNTEAKPEQRAIIDAVFRNQPIPQTSRIDSDPDDFADEPAPGPAPQSKDLAELRQAVSILMRREMDRNQQATEQSLRQKLAEFPALRADEGLLELTHNAVVQHLALHPAADRAAVVADFATQYSQWSRAATKEGRSGTGVPAVTPRASAASEQTEKPQFTADDMKKGRIYDAALKRLREMAAG
jgi:hypothetical protein